MWKRKSITTHTQEKVCVEKVHCQCQCLLSSSPQWDEERKRWERRRWKELRSRPEKALKTYSLSHSWSVWGEKTFFCRRSFVPSARRRAAGLLWTLQDSEDATVFPLKEADQLNELRGRTEQELAAVYRGLESLSSQVPLFIINADMMDPRNESRQLLQGRSPHNAGPSTNKTLIGTLVVSCPLPSPSNRLWCVLCCHRKPFSGVQMSREEQAFKWKLNLVLRPCARLGTQTNQRK